MELQRKNRLNNFNRLPETKKTEFLANLYLTFHNLCLTPPNTPSTPQPPYTPLSPDHTVMAHLFAKSIHTPLRILDRCIDAVILSY